MTVESLRLALDQVDERSCCSGTYAVREPIALALPDGDVGAATDARFVDWLLAHAEPAPYGHGTETVLDPKVRSAQRVKARDKIAVHGFDPAAVLDDIAAVLSPTAKLSAHLTDVIVYTKGDKFTRHKDTPRTADLIGTLVVGLPIAHTGGAFVVDDGRGEQKFDWSGKPAAGKLPWVALFSDVDHEIKPVKSGTRVTLVYALHRTAEPRRAVGADQRRALVTRAVSGLAGQDEWPVLIPCGRHVIAEPETEQPMALDCLRGADRDIADALGAAGYAVEVRACIVAIPAYNNPQPWPAVNDVFGITRLKKVPPPDLYLSLADGCGGDMADYTLDDIPIPQCAIRANAAAMLVHENSQWAMDGMDFGNEGFDAMVYTLAALEVTRATKPRPKAKAKAKAKPKAKAPAKKAKAKAKARR